MSNKMTMLEPTNLTEAMQFAETICKSGMVPKEYQGKPANTLVAIQWGYEVGLAPMQALQNISVINGKPTIWGDSAIALCKAHPDYRGCNEYIEGEVAVCEIKRQLRDGQVETTKRTFSVAEARTAGLLNKGGAWKLYPNRMLALRARGFALRDAFPDALKGIITTEEAQDYPEPKKTSAVEAVQAPQVSSEGDTIQNILEAVSEPENASKGMTESTTYFLNVPGKKSEPFQDEQGWVERYNELMLAVRQCSLPHAERRSKLKELEQANEYVLGIIDMAIGDELKEKRKKFNAGLSVEEKEQADESGTDTQTATGI